MGKKKIIPPGVGTSCSNPQKQTLQMARMPDGGRRRKSFRQKNWA